MSWASQTPLHRRLHCLVRQPRDVRRPWPLAPLCREPPRGLRRARRKRLPLGRLLVASRDLDLADVLVYEPSEDALSTWRNNSRCPVGRRARSTHGACWQCRTRGPRKTPDAGGRRKYDEPWVGREDLEGTVDVGRVWATRAGRRSTARQGGGALLGRARGLCRTMRGRNLAPGARCGSGSRGRPAIEKPSGASGGPRVVGHKPMLGRARGRLRSDVSLLEGGGDW